MAATRSTSRSTAAPKLTPRGVRLVTAAVFATATVAVLVWGVWPVVLTGAGIYAAKRAGVHKMIPTQRTALRGLGWGVAGVAMLMALSDQASNVAGGSALGVALSAALGAYLYLTRRTR